MGFSRQRYWSGLPSPTSGDLPDPGIEPTSLVSPALTSRFFTTEPPGKPQGKYSYDKKDTVSVLMEIKSSQERDSNNELITIISMFYEGWAFQVASGEWQRTYLLMQETQEMWVQSLGQEDARA